MPSRSAVVSNLPQLEALASEVLAETGSALAAVASGYFLAAGSLPGVLLCEAGLITANVGGQVRVFDGRLRQPGLGAKRPRGFTAKDAIPDAAFVAAPSAVQAVLVALAYDRSATPSRVVEPGVKAAVQLKAKERAKALRRIAAVGAAAFTEAVIAHPLLAVAGASQGGNLTLRDLGHTGEPDTAGKLRGNSDDLIELGAAWSADAAAPTRGKNAPVVIVAVDAHGRFAALSAAQAVQGLEIEELELVAPLAAIPVTRGVPRVAPGAALPSRIDLCARLTEAGVPLEMQVDLSAYGKLKTRRFALRQSTRARQVERVTRAR